MTMEVAAISGLAAWITISCLVISPDTVFADASSNLRSSLFRLITCPSTAQAACGIDIVGTESLDGISLGQCTNACNRISACQYYNYVEASDPDNCGQGLCVLFTNKPANLTGKPRCKLFKRSNGAVSRVNDDQFQFDAASACSYPFTYKGSLLYKCTRDQSVINDECVPFYCLANNQSPVKCYPSEFPPQLTTINLSVPPQPNITVASIVGWIVIQQRSSVSPSFNWQRPWQSYKNDFGTQGLNFWIGLERMHLLTSSFTYRLRVELQQMNTGSWFSAEYSSFSIDGETPDQYRLHVSGYSGDSGDALCFTGYNGAFYHDGMKFSTYDVDNDSKLFDNCAANRGGGWWFNACYWACTTCDNAHSDWDTLPGPSIYFTAGRMMIRAA